MLAFGLFYVFTFLGYLTMVGNGKNPFLVWPHNFPVDITHCIHIMSYLFQKWKKKLGVNDLVSEIKRVENCPDFEK